MALRVRKVLRTFERRAPGFLSRGLTTRASGIGYRTEWSSIRSVIIQMINKIGRPESHLLIKSMICNGDRNEWSTIQGVIGRVT